MHQINVFYSSQCHSVNTAEFFLVCAAVEIPLVTMCILDVCCVMVMCNLGHSNYFVSGDTSKALLWTVYVFVIILLLLLLFLISSFNTIHSHCFYISLLTVYVIYSTFIHTYHCLNGLLHRSVAPVDAHLEMLHWPLVLLVSCKQ